MMSVLEVVSSRFLMKSGTLFSRLCFVFDGFMIDLPKLLAFLTILQTLPISFQGAKYQVEKYLRIFLSVCCKIEYIENHFLKHTISKFHRENKQTKPEIWNQSVALNFSLKIA